MKNTKKNLFTWQFIGEGIVTMSLYAITLGQEAAECLRLHADNASRTLSQIMRNELSAAFAMESILVEGADRSNQLSITRVDAIQNEIDTGITVQVLLNELAGHETVSPGSRDEARRVEAVFSNYLSWMWADLIAPTAKNTIVRRVVPLAALVP